MITTIRNTLQENFEAKSLTEYTDYNWMINTNLLPEEFEIPQNNFSYGYAFGYDERWNDSNNYQTYYCKYSKFSQNTLYWCGRCMTYYKNTGTWQEQINSMFSPYIMNGGNEYYYIAIG